MSPRTGYTLTANSPPGPRVEMGGVSNQGSWMSTPWKQDLLQIWPMNVAAARRSSSPCPVTPGSFHILSTSS